MEPAILQATHFLEYLSKYYEDIIRCCSQSITLYKVQILAHSIRYVIITHSGLSC